MIKFKLGPRVMTSHLLGCMICGNFYVWDSTTSDKGCPDCPKNIVECPDDCGGCSCFSMPPCSHCVDGHGMEIEND